MNSLADIEKSTRLYADARGELTAIINELNDEIELAKRARLSAIKRAVAKTAEREADLRALVEGSPELFIRPRTVIFHGIKVGLAKGKGGLSFDDGDQVVKLIRKHFSEQADLLIHTKETPNKEALSAMSAAELKRLGVEIVDAGDKVVVKATDGDVEKIVNTLLGDALADAEAKEAA